MEWLVVLIMWYAKTADDLEPLMRLIELDAVRATAFERNDPSLLDGVYVSGSSPLAADKAVMRDYAERGARAVGADIEILQWAVLDRTDDRVRMRVVDRLGSASVQWADGTSDPLPRDEPTRRVITLVLTSEGWRIAG